MTVAFGLPSHGGTARDFSVHSHGADAVRNPAVLWVAGLQLPAGELDDGYDAVTLAIGQDDAFPWIEGDAGGKALEALMARYREGVPGPSASSSGISQPRSEACMPATLPM